MSISREQIISEIKRTAVTNGGKPLGRLAFRTHTGIKESDWIGRYWARWSEVLKEAGFEPNKLAEPLDESFLLACLADFAVELGRVPVYSELRLRKQTHPSFPSHNTFSKLGTRPQLIARLLEYCSGKSEYLALLPPLKAEVNSNPPQDEAKIPAAESVEGFVYIVRMGKHYKIGKTFAVPRRHREIALELPEKLEPVHVIRTDDPAGIEAYWHKRFQEKRTNGEWFALSPDDVRIFKKRKFM
jgi:hypothetical protein